MSYPWDAYKELKGRATTHNLSSISFLYILSHGLYKKLQYKTLLYHTLVHFLNEMHTRKHTRAHHKSTKLKFHFKMSKSSKQVNLKTILSLFVNKNLVSDRENTNQTNPSKKQKFQKKHKPHGGFKRNISITQAEKLINCNKQAGHAPCGGLHVTVPCDSIPCCR